MGIPNLSRRGVVSNPNLVVAPTNVNGSNSIRTVRADGPSPITRSSSKSSNAGYNISSTTGFNLCISSINNTSFFSRLVKIAARSPALAKTGPEVNLKFTPSSRAIICASVVFPNPGGPWNSVWSIATFLFIALSINTLKLSLASFWPIKSDNFCGRKALSASSNCISELVLRSP